MEFLLIFGKTNYVEITKIAKFEIYSSQKGHPTSAERNNRVFGLFIQNCDIYIIVII